MEEKKPNPFAGMIERRRRRLAGLAAEPSELGKRIIAAAANARGENSPDALTLAESSALAKSIIAAGQKRRGEKFPDAGGSVPTVLTGLAREIVDSAALRAAGGRAREKPNGIAAEIIEAGKKRRGEKS